MLIRDVGEDMARFRDIVPFMLTLDRDLLTNNMLVPFMVAAFESFLREFFVAYLETNPAIEEKIYEKRSKLDYGQIKELMDGSKSLARIEAEEYSFQSLRSANLAYGKYLDMDLLATFSTRKKHAGKVERVLAALDELLELRHRIVHEAFIDTELDRKRVERYLFYLRASGRLFVKAFLDSKGFRADLESYV